MRRLPGARASSPRPRRLGSRSGDKALTMGELCGCRWASRWRMFQARRNCSASRSRRWPANCCASCVRASASSSRSAWTTSPWTGPAPPSPAARPSASAWLPGRQRPHRSAVRPRRADHRPASARQRHRLLGSLHKLRDLGNTLVLVEHDREVIASADYLLDFGPGAGDQGGTITARGNPAAR